MAILFILIVISIATIASGENAWFGSVFLGSCIIILIGGLFIAQSEEKRAKEGKKCMENWERYKREQAKRR